MPTARTQASVATASAAAPTWLAALSGTRVAVLPLRGELGEREVAALLVRAHQLAASGRVALVLDLQRVTHWDYRALPELWQLAQQLRARGGDLRLAGPNRYLATILRFAGLVGAEGVLAVYSTAAAAAESFAAPLPQRERGTR